MKKPLKKYSKGFLSRRLYEDHESTLIVQIDLF